MAARLGSGFLEPHQIAFADVAAVGETEIAPEQRDGQGVAPDLAARRLELGVLLAYGRRAGARDAEAMQQPRAVGLTEVAEIVREHPARGVIRGALVFREVPDGLAGGDDAEPGLAGAGQRPQERLHAGGTQLAALRPGRMLERLEAVEDEQGSAPDDGPGQEPALVPGRELGIVLYLKPSQRVVEERIVRGLAVVARALAVEAPAIDPLCAAPTVGFEPIEPAIDEPRLPHPPPRPTPRHACARHRPRFRRGASAPPRGRGTRGCLEEAGRD